MFIPRLLQMYSNIWFIVHFAYRQPGPWLALAIAYASPSLKELIKFQEMETENRNMNNMTSALEQEKGYDTSFIYSSFINVKTSWNITIFHEIFDLRGFQSFWSHRCSQWFPRCTRPNIVWSLLWRHNGGECVSNHQPHDCLLNRLFGHSLK